MKKKCLDCQFFNERRDAMHKFPADQEFRNRLNSINDTNYIGKPYEFDCHLGCFKPMQDCEALRKMLKRKPKYKNCNYKEICPGFLSPATACQIVTMENAKKSVTISKWTLTVAGITLFVSGIALIFHFI